MRDLRPTRLPPEIYGEEWRYWHLARGTEWTLLDLESATAPDRAELIRLGEVVVALMLGTYKMSKRWRLPSAKWNRYKRGTVLRRATPVEAEAFRLLLRGRAGVERRTVDA